MIAHRWTIGLRIIAIIEVLKGSLVLVATAMVASSSWTMVTFMERVTHYMHLKQDGHIGHFFNVTIAHLPPGVLIWLAVAYMTLRFAEAYGLWKERHWGEWLAVLSAGVYVPAEIYELCLHYSHVKVAVLVVNVAIILFLIWVLWKTRGNREAGRENVN